VAVDFGEARRFLLTLLRFPNKTGVLKSTVRFDTLLTAGIFRIKERRMATKYRVVQVKGAKPETFIVVGIDFAEGAITSTSESMQQDKMRSYLEKAGATKKEIETWIEQARKYPG
jgi:hypothetical protein